MDFLRINSSKIKITMSRLECDRYGISERGGDYDSKLVREALSDILEDAGAEGFAKTGEKLLVQLYPAENGGAEIFVTKINNLGERERRAISRADNLTTYNKERASFVFESPRELYRAASLLKKDKPSDLYRMCDGRFLLFIEEEHLGGLSDLEILSEFSTRVPVSEYLPSPEWDTLIFKDNAVFRLKASQNRDASK